MKLTKEECKYALNDLYGRWLNQDDNAMAIEEDMVTLEQLIEEHFTMLSLCKGCESKFLKGISDAEKEVDKLRKALDEVREQGASAMDEAQKYKKLYEEQLERNEVQKKRMKQLQQENENLNKKVHSYYMAMVTGKGA